MIRTVLPFLLAITLGASAHAQPAAPAPPATPPKAPTAAPAGSTAPAAPQPGASPATSPPATSPPAAPPPAAPPPVASPGPANSKTFDDARARMEKAQRSFADGKYDDALTEFLGAHERHKFSAFLFNAAVAAEKGAKRELSVELYERFLKAEPQAPDRADIEKTIARLRREHTDQAPEISADTQRAAIKSLVLVESEPLGAPVSIYEKTDPKAPPFDRTKAEQPGYRKVLGNLTTPANVSLSLGSYFVLVEGFADYNPTGSEFTFEAGRVYVYRASLSQGDFVGRVEIELPVRHAEIWIDDPPPHKNAPRAVGPASVELTPGKHTFYVEATGFEPFKREVVVVQGKTIKLDAKLERVDYGYLLVKGNAPLVEVLINGHEAGTYKRKGEPLRVRVPAGDHLVEIDADGKKAYEALITVPRGQEVTVDTKLEESPGRGGAVVVTLLAAGSLAGAIVLNRHVAGMADGEEGKEPLTYTSYGLFGGAGAFTALAIFLFVFDPEDDSTAKLGAPREFSGELPKDKQLPKDLAQLLQLELGVGLGATPLELPVRGVNLPAPMGAFVRGTF